MVGNVQLQLLLPEAPVLSYHTLIEQDCEYEYRMLLISQCYSVFVR